MEKADTVLDVTQLEVRFRIEEGDLPAVNGVDFSLRRGSTLALVGESGCGKSVTSLAIMRLINPPGRIAGGSIRIQPSGRDTIDITALSEKDDLLYSVRGGMIGMIFQEPMTALSPVHTIGNQICEAILLHCNVNEKTAQERAIAMLDNVGISNAAQRMRQYPHELSGGLRQRVVIAMALAAEPEILIADEPTTALDVTIQAQILQLLKELQQKTGVSILFITHDLGVVAQVADDVAVMYMGRIAEYGPVRNVLKNPRHPYTRALLQSLPALHRRGERLASIPGRVPSLANVPEGCSFHPRCQYAEQKLCDIPPAPQLQQAAEDHSTACLRWQDVFAEKTQ